MSKKWKRVIILAGGAVALYVVFLIVAICRHIVNNPLPPAGPIAYELTEQEKDLLIDEWPGAEELIREGKLYNHQAYLLNEIREGMAYLEEKYPDYKFHINYRDDWAVTIIDYSVTEETTGESFRLHFHTDEERRHQPEDDFYIYFIEDDYQKYIEEQFMQRSGNVTEVTVSIMRTKGKGYDDKITMDDIIDGKFDLDPIIHVYVLAGEKTETWCEDYAEKKMKKVVEEINLSGTYVIDFYIIPEGEENAEQNEEFIDYNVIFWDRNGEGNG